MKKKIYPHSLIYSITIALYLSIVLLSLYVNIICWNKLILSKEAVLIIPIVATLFAIIMFLISLVDLLANKLVITCEGILVTGQKLNKGIQYKEFINYSFIKDIKVICAHIDSKGKTIKNNGVASMRPHIFFEFIMQDDSSKLLHIEIYSISQRKKILDIVNEMTNLNFLYSELEKVDKSIFKRRTNTKKK